MQKVGGGGEARHPVSRFQKERVKDGGRVCVCVGGGGRDKEREKRRCFFLLTCSVLFYRVLCVNVGLGCRFGVSAYA